MEIPKGRRASQYTDARCSKGNIGIFRRVVGLCDLNDYFIEYREHAQWVVGGALDDLEELENVFHIGHQRLTVGCGSTFEGIPVM